jgi:hypothetical protein
MVAATLLNSNANAASRRFNASEIAGQSSDFFVADLDGDGLKDLVLLKGFKLAVFFQDAERGFANEPQLRYSLGEDPCVIWATKLAAGGGTETVPKPAAETAALRTGTNGASSGTFAKKAWGAESVLVMTSRGVAELRFTTRTNGPTIRQIVEQQTILPEKSMQTNGVYLRLSVETKVNRLPVQDRASDGGSWRQKDDQSPLLIVPTREGLQVWSMGRDAHAGEGRRWGIGQTITNAVDHRLRPTFDNPGYDAWSVLNFSVDDVNGDGREDLMIRSREIGLTNTYRLYLQQTNGLFSAEPVVTYGDRIEPHAWLGWIDINGDGKVDLIKSTWLNEPSLIPAHSSGKVIVRIYMADKSGNYSAEPQQVFRKNDWLPPVPVLDIDGDGFADLALGFSPLETREGIRKEITAKQLDLNLKFYFFRPGTGFPKEADSQRDLAIRMDETELLLSWGRGLYFESYVQFGGDFDGDGKTDLLVRDHKDSISVYSFISRDKGFSTNPSARLSCPGIIQEWLIEDLNNDGVSDLLVRVEQPNAIRVFVSQK